MDAFMFWFWKSVAELAFGLAVAVGIVVVYLLIQLPGMIKQMTCKHKRFFENGRCQAICRDCGKDLGFIATWREKQSKETS